MSIATLLLIAALVLLLLAALNVPAPARLSYGWMGLFLVLLVRLLDAGIFR